jgi:hypothetical protein
MLSASQLALSSPPSLLPPYLKTSPSLSPPPPPQFTILHSCCISILRYIYFDGDAEYKELWKVILAEYIEREVQLRIVGGNIPPIQGFTFEGTW